MATVVIAEDDAALRAAFAEVLTRAGHSVIACPDGDCALPRIRDHRPDLVVTDVDMPPGMSGLDMLVAIRADPATAAIPVIVATGGRIRADAATAVGATLLLHKPVPPRVLVAQVNAVLGGDPGTTSSSASDPGDPWRRGRPAHDVTEVGGAAASTAWRR